MRKSQRINGIHILILCLFALIKIGEANEIRNPQFFTTDCKIDPDTHTCIVPGTSVQPWQTTRKKHRLELTTLTDISLLFDSLIGQGEPSSMYLCVLRQSRSDIISQIIPLINVGVFRAAFDVIAADLEKSNLHSSLTVGVLRGKKQTTKTVSVQLGVGLRRMAVYLPMDEQSILIRSQFQFFLANHRAKGVVVAVSNWKLEPYIPQDPTNKIINGKFDDPKLNEGQDQRIVQQDDVSQWKIINVGYIVRWVEPAVSFTQGFMFCIKQDYSSKISQEFYVEDDGVLKIQFFFKYGSSKNAKGVLYVQIGKKLISEITMDSQQGKYEPMTIYPYSHDQDVKKGNKFISLSAYGASSIWMNIYLANVKIIFTPKEQEHIYEQIQGQDEQASGHQFPEIYQNIRPSRMQSNFLSNGDFSQPQIRQQKSTIRVTGYQVPSWYIQGMGWLQRRNQQSQCFLFGGKYRQVVQLKQIFQLRIRMEVQLRFGYCLISKAAGKSTLSISINGCKMKKILLTVLEVGKTYLFHEQCILANLQRINFPSDGGIGTSQKQVKTEIGKRDPCEIPKIDVEISAKMISFHKSSIHVRLPIQNLTKLIPFTQAIIQCKIVNHSFIYKFDSQSLTPNRLYLLFSMERLRLRLKQIKKQLGNLYSQQKYLYFKGQNTLSLIAITLLNHGTLLLIFDVSIKHLAQLRQRF